AAAMVPSGASTGRHEALELRDGPGAAYGGRSVLRAVEHVNTEINAAPPGLGAREQALVDQYLVGLGGSHQKARRAAEGSRGASMAVARAAARAEGAPLWEYLAGGRVAAIPVPMINIISGGRHAGGNIEFQDFMIVPRGFASFGEKLECAVGIHRQMARM